MDVNRLRSSAGGDIVKHILTGADHIIGPWVMEQTDGAWVNGRGSTIGLLDDNRIVAGCLFSDYNGASVMLHCAGEGKKWLNREFLWYTFHYPFEELVVNKIISPVESTNSQCRKFIEHIGFSVEATLKHASPKGDLLIYTMDRLACRWLDLKGKYRGEAQGS